MKVFAMFIAVLFISAQVNLVASLIQNLTSWPKKAIKCDVKNFDDHLMP